MTAPTIAPPVAPPLPATVQMRPVWRNVLVAVTLVNVGLLTLTAYHLGYDRGAIEAFRVTRQSDALAAATCGLAP